MEGLILSQQRTYPSGTEGRKRKKEEEEKKQQDKGMFACLGNVMFGVEEILKSFLKLGKSLIIVDILFQLR